MKTTTKKIDLDLVDRLVTMTDDDLKNMRFEKFLKTNAEFQNIMPSLDAVCMDWLEFCNSRLDKHASEMAAVFKKGDVDYYKIGLDPDMPVEQGYDKIKEIVIEKYRQDVGSLETREIFCSAAENRYMDMFNSDEMDSDDYNVRMKIIEKIRKREI